MQIKPSPAVRRLSCVLALALALGPLPSQAVTVTALEIDAAGGGGDPFFGGVHGDPAVPVAGIKNPVIVESLAAAGASFTVTETIVFFALISVLVSQLLPNIEGVRTAAGLQAIVADNPGIELVELGPLPPATYQLLVTDPPAGDDVGLMIVALESTVAVPLPATLPLALLGLGGLLLVRARRRAEA